MDVATEFMKLEKIEFGGIKGKMLSSQVVQIWEEFNEHYKLFTERSYDSLDPQDPAFLQDYDEFKAVIADLDKRLATIVCQGFDDCSGTEAIFRVCFPRKFPICHLKPDRNYGSNCIKLELVNCFVTKELYLC